MKAAGLIALLLTLASAAEAQPPGDARRGGVIFRERGCLDCHSFQGAGAGSAPDLSRRPGGEYTPARLTALIWNHAPTMWRAMRQKNMAVPALEPREVGDLFTYFYSARFFEPAGDAARGKAAFTAKNCAACHAPNAQLTGPPISEWNEVADPVAWVREMWNHSATMAEKMRAKRLAYPRLSGQELADLLVYFKNLPAARSRSASFSSADPEEGKRVFDQKGCLNCHVLRDRQAGKVTLPAADRPFQSLADIAADMWNHAPEMQRRAKAGTAAFPTFTGSEMNNLVGYLFWVGYFDEKGDPNRGQRVFTAKLCADCHTSGPGPDLLAAFQGKASPTTITSALWKHPAMLNAFESQRKPWPQFAGAEMADMIAYLYRGKK